VHLKLQPASLGRAAKGLGQADSHLGRNAGMAVEQHRQRLAADPQPGRGLGDRQLQRLDGQITDDRRAEEGLS
jgi:hypothetical protein